MLRNVLGFLSVASLAACFINGNGQAQGEAKDNGNGNGSENGSGNGVVVAVESDNEGPSNGTWDITTAGGAAIEASSMTVTGTKAKGVVVKKGEGATDPHAPRCTRTKNRTEFELEAEDDDLVGTFTVVREWTGSQCPPNEKKTITLTGTRKKSGKNDLDGDWSITCTDESVSFDAMLRVGASTGLASATSSRPEVTFAARRR